VHVSDATSRRVRAGVCDATTRMLVVQLCGAGV
jgi:hypothetical protein